MQLFLLYLRNWAMSLVVVILLFRTGSKNSEDDREETLWFDWSWYQSRQRRGISGARKTSDYLIDCTKHQEGVLGDGQKLPPRISKQPEGRICGGLNTWCSAHKLYVWPRMSVYRKYIGFTVCFICSEIPLNMYGKWPHKRPGRLFILYWIVQVGAFNRQEAFKRERRVISLLQQAQKN